MTCILIRYFLINIAKAYLLVRSSTFGVQPIEHIQTIQKSIAIIIVSAYLPSQSYSKTKLPSSFISCSITLKYRQFYNTLSCLFLPTLSLLMP